MPHTLVTGANSFVAAHIIIELLAKGHTVTGTVRRTFAGNKLLTQHPEWKGRFDFEVVEDYAEKDAFSAIFQARQYHHIVHTAAPMPGASDDFDNHFLRPGIDGTLTLLNGAKKYAPTLQSMAMTGSVNTITGTIDSLMARSPEENREDEFTNDMWNEITPAFARRSGSQYIMYCASKKESELAVWEWVKNQKPNFNVRITFSTSVGIVKAKTFDSKVTVFLPALIFGPPPSLEQLNFSVSFLYNFFNGTFKELPDTYSAGLFPSYIDVRDLATAHVRALTTPGAANKRFLIGGAELTSSLILNTFTGLVEKGVLPELKGRLPKDTGKDNKTRLLIPVFAAKDGNEVLELTVRSVEETLKDVAKRIVELENLER